MNELQRQHYLNQCGITLWYSHAPLAGAAPSIEFEFPLDEGEGGGPAEAVGTERSKSESTRPKRTVVLDDHLPALHREIAKTVHVSSPTDSFQDALPPSLQEAELYSPTRLSVELRIAASSKLVVIAQTGPGVSSDIQEKLLLQISQSLGQPVFADSLEVIAWPVFNNRSVPGNNDAGLTAVLQSVLAESRSRIWLGLGPESRELMAILDRDSSDSGPRVSCRHALDELALSGPFKRELWQEIRHLTITENAR